MYLYGLIIGISIVVGIEICSHRNKIIPKSKESFFIISLLIASIFGARIYHVIDYWDYYSQHLYQIPQTWNGGLGIFGGLIGGITFIYFFCYYQKLNFLKTVDLITPILPLCQSIGRLGNWVNNENPLWWIEAVANLILFFLIYKFPKNPTAKYLIGYGLIRLFTDFYRTDLWIINSVKISQIFGLVFVILGVNLIYRERFKITKNNC